MADLPTLQKNFQDHIISADAQITQYLLSTEKIDAQQRLKIYSDAYRLRLIEVLQADYPALHTLLGDESFDTLGQAYIAAYPSQYRSVRWFGQHMADFISNTKPYLEQSILGEMAMFEWALRNAFDAADVAIVMLEKMRVIPPEKWANMQIIFHPSIYRLKLQWNVISMWNAATHDAAPVLPEKYVDPINWIVWRQELATLFRSLSVDEAWAFDAALQGATFGNICVGLGEWSNEEELATHAASLLKRWINDGLITEILVY